MIQDTPSIVPRLATSLNGPRLELERHFLTRQTEIERWFRSQGLQTPAPFCASVDKTRYPADCVNRFYAYGVVARLAALAAARELRQVSEPLVSELRSVQNL